jgi:hypothetical protein
MVEQSNITFYSGIVKNTLEFFIQEQTPFLVSLLKTEELSNYLPEVAFNDKGVCNILFDQWTLEVAFVKNEQFNCIVVYGETEYPMVIEFLDILRISHMPSALLVVNKFFVENNLFKKEEKKNDNVPSKEAVAKSMSGMRLLKPGEE